MAFEILPRDRDWEAAELGAALQILDSTNSNVDRRKGCRMLRFLATDAAVDEMVRRYGAGQAGCDFDYMAGLFGAPNRDRVVQQMEAGLRADDQPIHQWYLRNLALLSVYLQHPEFRPAQTRAAKARLIPPGELSRHPELIQAAETKYADILDAAIPYKTERARAITLAHRLDSPQRDSTAAARSASSRDTLPDQLAATFLELPAERQVMLLEHRWRSFASPKMLPVLRRLAESPRRPPSFSLADLALRRLYELAPEEGRPLILRQIRNPPAGASVKTLGMLPERELPELDDILAANLEADRDFSICAELVNRYASSGVSARVLRHVEDLLPRMACQPQSALLAYFMRVDSDLGGRLLERALASRAMTGCFRSVLRDVATRRMTPAVEAVALAHLDDPDPDVVISAVDTLGRYGSPAAEQPLRAQFERWHDTWEGRQEDIRFSHAQDRPNAAQGMVEHAFLNALARGSAWLTGSHELMQLRALCVTDQCRTQADQLMSSADDARINIARIEDPDESSIQLAQYELRSMAALEQKLAQYPKGTSFALDVSALDPQLARATASRLTTFAAARGIDVRQ